eukprot:11909148-Heterocapsa_arctica.AAC.1
MPWAPGTGAPCTEHRVWQGAPKLGGELGGSKKCWEMYVLKSFTKGAAHRKGSCPGSYVVAAKL